MSKRFFILLGSLLLLSPFNPKASNKNYPSNKPPLAETPFIQLPIGSVKADGWLRHQLELQRDGLTGYAELLYKEDKNLGPNSNWLGGNGDSWERAPYYVKGLTALAYTLDDDALQAKAQKWINWSLDNQQSNGSFGPPAISDWWAKMPMLYAIRDFYEATGDKRVIPFFTRYFQYQNNTLANIPLSEWARSRAGDNIEIIFWLYNQTGDSFLLELADKLKNQAYNWTDIFTNNKFMYFTTDFQPKHNVNVPQAIKMPAIYYLKSKAEADRDAYFNGHNHLMHDHGQPHGMQSGNEMLNGRSAMTGVELCSVVENMQSCETVQMILGDASIGDQLEQIAFNALPGGISKDFKGSQYYTQSNQVMSKRGNTGFGQNYENGLTPGPYSGFPCCRYNLHMGWPYFVKTLWAATNDNGLAVMAYSPCSVNAKVADNVRISFREETNYPFDEQATFTFSAPQQVSFPLKLRIPGWCKTPVVKVNNILQKEVKAGQFYTINRKWNNGDRIVVEFPMSVKIEDQVNNSVSVHRGPLVYSLKIGENWQTRQDFGNGFKEYDVLPTSDWNYALLINKEHPEKSFKVNKQQMPQNPFEQKTTPITLTTSARKLPSWTLALNNRFAVDPPYSPVESSEATEEITLVPYGAENIRVTCFPYIGKPTSAQTSFKDNFSDNNQDGWINYGGSLYVDNGVYVATNPEGSICTKSLQSSTQFSDFTYDAKVKVNSNGGDCGLVFRTSQMSMGPDEYKGYYVGLSMSGQKLILGKANGNWTLLKEVDFAVKNNQWYQLRVIAIGSQIQVFVDDMSSSKITMKDDSFQSGSIGLRAYNAQGQWDDFVVTAN